MKNNFFQGLRLFSAFFLLVLLVLSCDQAKTPTTTAAGDNPSSTTIPNGGVTTIPTDPTDPNNPSGGSTTTTLANLSKSLSFNNRNGKAIASIDPASDNHLYRGTTTQKFVTLAKILEDGTLESFFVLSKDATVDSWPEVNFITKSPYTGDVYISFKTPLSIRVKVTKNLETNKSEITEEETNGGEFTEGGFTEGEIDKPGETTTEGEYEEPTSPVTIEETYKIGEFICVKQDGTYFDILKKEGGGWGFLNVYSDNDPIVFDKNGNMYYNYVQDDISSGVSNMFSAFRDTGIPTDTKTGTETTMSGSPSTTTTIPLGAPKIVNAIYKFDPKTNLSSLMTEKKEDIYYKRFFVSKDGKYLFAEAFQMIGGVLSANLRAIPVDSPSGYKDIFSVSDLSQGFVNSFAVSDDNTVYYSGNGMGKDKLYGIFSAKETDYEKSTHDIHNLYDEFSYARFFEARFDSQMAPTGIYWSTYGGYVKHEKVFFINEDGTTNSKNILDCMREFTPYPKSTFSLKILKSKCGLQLDDTLIDEKAVEALDFDNIQLLFKKYFDTDGFGDKQFLIDAFGLSETDINLSIKYSSQLSVASDGSIWGITLGGACKSLENTWKESFIRLYNKDGKPSVYAPPALKDGAFLPIKLQMGEGHIYFSCLLKDSTEYHTIKCASLANPDTLIDVFQNVPNNANIKILDYSISGDDLYFSGLKGGTDPISGKINLTGQSFTFTETAQGFKINKILAY